DARRQGAQLVLFPELALTGYPPEDLLLREHFLADAAAALRELASSVRDLVAVVGYPERAEDVYNAAAVLAHGRVHASYRKIHLPNYGVFDEQRYFRAGRRGAVIDIGEPRAGLTVCEDIWEPGPPASEEALAGATLIINISASPYYAGKGMERERMFAQRARESVACVAFCALVGGQDELVFDGQSCVIDHTGATIARAAQFREDMLLCEVDLAEAAATRLRQGAHRSRAPGPERAAATLQPIAARPPARAAAGSPAGGSGGSPAGRSDSSAARGSGGAPAPRERRVEPVLGAEAEVYEALQLGLRDYVHKNHFPHVVLGLSGGVDSALVACLAADALGPARVSVAIMPSRYSSAGTQADARAIAAALGVGAHELPIEPILARYTAALAAEFAGRPQDATEENLQARVRGNLLMALSNKFNWLVLTTGNKSEMSVGYTTLYGDLAGGFAVIKDVPKTLVYRLAAWRNTPAGAGEGRAPSPIPASVLERPPSAELRAEQRDQDSLPPYELLDRILHGYIELDSSREQLIATGLPQAEVERITRLVDLAEYKRRQAPPGVKVTVRAFGRDRRMPITNSYRG
ncbi:MAG: NAD+ synthase, partial [Solirubrobacterales bacterium]|nr:NAD+ synthase [Solirubrobacterales bacterium]